MKTKQIRLKAKYRSFNPGAIIFTSLSIMQDLVNRGLAEWTDEETEEVIDLTAE